MWERYSHLYALGQLSVFHTEGEVSHKVIQESVEMSVLIFMAILIPNDSSLCKIFTGCSVNAHNLIYVLNQALSVIQTALYTKLSTISVDNLV
ncbi:hypothetical protein HNR39_004415 [Glaciimonas immobilis]|uniref:Uncharacterized protein n=1 Tax=Glaciimonas immobilis TaxID=728004 RepID=A0A840RZL6_9BURK|nr:hypothetical protein [Glaciimonas immobilis]